MSHFEFDMKLPMDTWQDQTMYAIKGPTIERIEHLLMLYIDREPMQDIVEQFAKEKVDIITENLQGLTVIKKTEISIPGGNPTYEFVASWALADNFIKIKRYVFVLANDMGFTFNCDFQDTTFDQLKPDMNKIIDHLVPNTFAAAEGATVEPTPPARSAPPVQAPPSNSDHLW